MIDHAVLEDREAFWILAVNTLLHELGVPVPMMPTALLVGARVASGAIDPLPPIVAIVAATVIGNSVWFAAGRWYGAGVLKLLCRLSLSADRCVSRTESVFGRLGWSSLVVGRFLPGVSLIAPPLAGALGMKWSRFLVLTGAGAALYGLVVVGAGMLLAAQIESALRQLDGVGSHALAAIAVILALYVVGRWWTRDRSRVPSRSRWTRSRRAARSNRPIILYCACPNEASAAKAARLLLARGYPRARPLRGGLDAWIAAGHGVEATPSAAGDPDEPSRAELTKTA
jgi:membrane protein DedA with SNARE-associated domain